MGAIPSTSTVGTFVLPGHFDRSSGSWTERLIFNNRIAFIVLCALITAVLGWQAGRLGLNASYERMLPSRHEFIRQYQAHRLDLSGLGNTLRIAVVAREGGTILQPGYLDALKNLNDELFLLPGVDRPFVRSLWTPSTRWLGVTDEGLDGGPVIPDNYDGSADSLELLRANIERSGELGTLVAADYSSSIIMVPLTEATHPIDYRAFDQRLEALRSKYAQRGLTLHVVGFAKIVGDLLAGLQQILGFFGVALAICTAVLYGYTRCVRSTLLVVGCSLVAVLWLLGLLPMLGIELDPY